MPDDTDLAARLIYVTGRLARELALHWRDGLTVSSVAILDDLADGPKTPGMLASLERMRPPSVTRHITALAEQALISREAVTGTGRRSRVMLALTASGRVALDKARQDLWLAGRLAALDPAERAVLADALPVLEKLHTVNDAKSTE